MKTIGIGVIGWGFMGKTHTEALRNMPLFYADAPFRPQLSCICTRRIEKAREAMRDAGFLRCTDDYRELLAMEDVDVVSICTPNADHEAMAIAALKAGKHVYIDKPLSVTAESAARIAQAAAAAPVKTRVVFNNRYFPATMRLKQLVDEGRLGNILGFEGRYLHSGSIDPNRAVGWKMTGQGGVLLDMGAHILDLITWYLGYPARVSCRKRVLYPSRPAANGMPFTALSDDQALMMLEMPGGALGTIEASKIATGADDELSLTLRGDRGALRWNSMQPNYLEYYDLNAQGAPFGGLRGFTQIECVARYDAPGGSFLPPKNSIGWDRAHLHCYFDFLNAVAQDLPCGCTVAEGARLQALMETLSRSAERGGAWEAFA